MFNLPNYIADTENNTVMFLPLCAFANVITSLITELSRLSAKWNCAPWGGGVGGGGDMT